MLAAAGLKSSPLSFLRSSQRGPPRELLREAGNLRAWHGRHWSKEERHGNKQLIIILTIGSTRSFVILTDLQFNHCIVGPIR